MACELRIFLGDEAERMCDLLNINPQSFCVDALQQEIHCKSVVRACTKFNQNEGRGFEHQ